jgi:hypothetical protein
MKQGQITRELVAAFAADVAEEHLLDVVRCVRSFIDRNPAIFGGPVMPSDEGEVNSIVLRHLKAIALDAWDTAEQTHMITRRMRGQR